MGDQSPILQPQAMGKISQEKREAVRGRLLDQATRYFPRHAYDGRNINEIALDAGFAKGTIYNYFKSKDALFGEVIAEWARRAVDRYSPAHRDSDSVRNSLKSLAVADVSVFREEEPFAKLIIGEAMSPRSDTYELVLTHLSPF